MRGVKRDFDRIEIKSRSDLRRWFERNGDRRESVWIVTYKKRVNGLHVPYSDVRDEALCFGWIDSRPAKLDDRRSMLLVSPRKPGSAWSAINKDRVAALSAEGRMTQAGNAAVEEAKQDGSWTFLDDVERLEEPADLVAALIAEPDAHRFWRAFPPSTRRGILEWIKQAKRTETRQKRIRETARLAAQNIRANAPRRAPASKD
ncbi:MAG: YdeI/OmpD-associated family protein [Pseudomonadota bacterium]